MEIKIETTIDRVVVYPDQARVTCSGSCDLTAGTHHLVIDELPLVLVPDSVRAAGSGTARVRLMGVDLHRQHYESTPAKQVRRLEQEIEKLEDEMRVMEDDRAGWKAHAGYLDGLRQATAEFARGLARGRTNIEDQAQLTRFLQEQDTAVRTAVRDLDARQRELKRQLDKLNRDLKEASSARPRQRFQTRIEVEALTDGQFQPELTYLVRKTGWRPLYDVRFTESDEGHSIAVTYLAQVTQNSGQDWQKVDLVVSTARPALNQKLPALKPWFVDVYSPPQHRSRPMAVRSALPEAAPAADLAVKGAAAPAEAEPPTSVLAQAAVAGMQDSGTAINFTVAGKVDIPSDGSPHKSTLNQFTLEPRLDYLAVPKHTDAVYRRAAVKNSSPSPLLTGAANLFIGEEFIGQTRLDYTPVDGECELLLGVEERITVEREMIRRDVDKRLLRDNRQLRYGYEIKVENLLARPIQLEVHDHIPISRHEEIKVKLEQVRPEPAERSELNMLEWQLPIAAGEEKVIRYEYSVEHPRSLRVAGLLD